jgi:hypothetical protein
MKTHQLTIDFPNRTVAPLKRHIQVRAARGVALDETRRRRQLAGGAERAEDDGCLRTGILHGTSRETLLIHNP